MGICIVITIGIVSIVGIICETIEEVKKSNKK